MVGRKGTARWRGGKNKPLSSLAFSSRTASLYASPSNCLARHNTLVVLPMPGMPEMMTCGMLPSRAMILSRSMVSVLPTTSSRKTGRYFSTQGSSYVGLPLAVPVWALYADVDDSPVVSGFFAVVAGIFGCVLILGIMGRKQQVRVAAT